MYLPSFRSNFLVQRYIANESVNLYQRGYLTKEYLARCLSKVGHYLNPVTARAAENSLPSHAGTWPWWPPTSVTSEGRKGTFGVPAETRVFRTQGTVCLACGHVCFERFNTRRTPHVTLQQYYSGVSSGLLSVDRPLVDSNLNAWYVVAQFSAIKL